MSTSLSHLSENGRNLLLLPLLQRAPVIILFLHGITFCSQSKGSLISYREEDAVGTGAGGGGLLVCVLSACSLTTELFPNAAEVAPEAPEGDGNTGA